MESKELFDYIYMYDLKKIKEAIKFIEEIVQLRINNEDVNKSNILRIILTADDFATYFTPEGSLRDGFTTEEFEEAYKTSKTKTAQDIIDIIVKNKQGY